MIAVNEGRQSNTGVEAAADVGLNSNGVLTIRFKKDRLIILEGNANLLKIGAHLGIAVVNSIQDDKVLRVCN
ncbi:hypothetical protein [Variovorax sp. YR266]|uniref:hypothetical protein n=1 Tax=Variovorax sp. YR266 TaxID=1884386 RepID=UPI00115F91DA|nr:hypothetical protein [Variovorax sp. YR266]